MPTPKRRLLDSFAILALLGDEDGADRVADLLTDAVASDLPLLVNEINVGEVYHIVGRYRSLDEADRVIDHLESLPLEWIGNGRDEVLAAARVKARHPVSYADAFAIATAMRFDAVVVTGDREFESVDELVDIEWTGEG